MTTPIKTACDSDSAVCVMYIANYIHANSTPIENSTGYSCVSYEHLARAIHKSNVTWGRINNPNVVLGNHEYAALAFSLLNSIKVAERQPIGIYQLIMDARSKWRAEVLSKINNKPIAEPNIKFEVPAVFSDITFEQEPSSQLLSDTVNIFRRCDFCLKETKITERTSAMLEKLTSPKQFFCHFCVRNDFHSRKRKNILIMSMRAIIGSLYYHCYVIKKPKMYYSQITDMIDTHVKIGMLNPLFEYDPSTFFWFIDFARVGKGSKQLALHEVDRTVNEMLSAFNLYEYFRDFKSSKLVEKFAEATKAFYAQRSRPDGKKMLIPTLVGCAIETKESLAKEQKTDYISLRDFLPGHMQLSNRH